MSDASKPVTPQPQQADPSRHRAPVIRLCALFGATMAAAYAVQGYDNRLRLKNEEAAAPETCAILQDRPHAAGTVSEDVRKKTCPDVTLPATLTPIS